MKAHGIWPLWKGAFQWPTRMVQGTLRRPYGSRAQSGQFNTLFAQMPSHVQFQRSLSHTALLLELSHIAFGICSATCLRLLAYDFL